MDASISAFKTKFWQVVRLPKKVSRRIDAFIDPRLGKLFHYPPRPLRIPKKYTQEKRSQKECLSISIVTPSFQSGIFIEETIRSVIEQGYPCLEYVVQDGGSDDDTVSIIKKYEKKMHTWESKPDKGQAHAINLGFDKTQGDVMAWLNADDLLLPGALDYINKFFQANPQVDVVYGHRVLIDADSNDIGRWIMPPHCHHTITWHDFIPQETLFWRKSIWEKAGGRIADEMQFAMDWEFILRLREVGANFVRLPRFIGAFRVHPDMKSIKDVDTTGIQEMDMLRKRYREPGFNDEQLENCIRSYLRKHIFLDKLYKLRLLRC